MGMQTDSGSSRSSRTTLSEINITPLVDVMLVLLIIFMVTAPMMQQGLDVDLPETANSGLSVKDDPFVIILKKGNKVTIGAADVSISDLKPKLTAIFANRKDKQIYIQADKAVPYGFVAEAMAEIKSAGINNIGLVTIPKSGP